MTAADAGADAGPLWLRLAIALIPPVLAAIIAGYFALSNTVNRRAERLKNLNDIRVSTSSECINQDFALERIILRELKALDRATTPILKWETRFYVLAGSLTALAYTIHVLEHQDVINLPPSESHALNIIAGSIVLAFGLLIFIDIFVLKTTESGDSLKERYSRRFAALDNRATQAQKPPSQSGQQDAPESKSSTEATVKGQRAANRTIAPHDRNLPD